MRSSFRLLFLLSLTVPSLSAPTPDPLPDLTIPNLPFNLISLIPKYLNNPPNGVCSLDKVTLPASTLPPPTTDLSLILVALGRGTQNYTCATSTAASKPTPAGALANLFNANCFAAHLTSSQLDTYTVARASSPKTPEAQFPLPLVGDHFFVDSTTPVFAVQDLGGATALKKLAAVPAPDATKNVAWLKLGAVATGAADGSTRVKEVYRVRTVGGVPPATCEGVQGGALTVEYAAIYHFYASAA